MMADVIPDVLKSPGRWNWAGCVEEVLQRRSDGSVATARSAPVVEPQQHGPHRGQCRHFCEAKFGANFSTVRLYGVGSAHRSVWARRGWSARRSGRPRMHAGQLLRWCVVVHRHPSDFFPPEPTFCLSGADGPAVDVGVPANSGARWPNDVPRARGALPSGGGGCSPRLGLSGVARPTGSDGPIARGSPPREAE